MTRHESAELLDQLATDIAQATKDWKIGNEVDVNVVINHAKAMAGQLRNERPVISVIESSWSMIMRFKTDPVVESWLKLHGRPMVALFRTL